MGFPGGGVLSGLCFSVLPLVSVAGQVCGRGRGLTLRAADEAHLKLIIASPAGYQTGLLTTTLPDNSVLFGPICVPRSWCCAASSVIVLLCCLL